MTHSINNNIRNQNDEPKQKKRKLNNNNVSKQNTQYSISLLNNMAIQSNTHDNIQWYGSM